MPDIDNEKTCCFFGHRKIEETAELKNNLCEIIEILIVNEKIDTFLFGSKSQFDDLCHEVTTELKEKYPHIKRIYVRAAFQHIPDWYEDSLLKHYEGTYFPKHMENAGKASYVERNQEMINHSKFCVVYYDENYAPPRRRNSRRDLTDYQPKSGTKAAYNYAVKKKKKIVNVRLEKMTFEKVMEIFKEQFEIDKDIEVANFRRGYQIFIWDSRQEAYLPNDELIQTTEGLFNELLNETRRFYELKYRNPKTEKIDDGYVAEIEKIIADLQNKYRQSV